MILVWPNETDLEFPCTQNSEIPFFEWIEFSHLNKHKRMVANILCCWKCNPKIRITSYIETADSSEMQTSFSQNIPKSQYISNRDIKLTLNTCITQGNKNWISGKKHSKLLQSSNAKKGQLDARIIPHTRRVWGRPAPQEMWCRKLTLTKGQWVIPRPESMIT